MPLFSDPRLHSDLITALELQIADRFPGAAAPDVVVGLESRGFLFGPTLALRLGAGFVPVRKQGKLPGECLTEGYQKEYGTDFFQMQADAIRKGQKVLIVDDIIATGECPSDPPPLLSCDSWADFCFFRVPGGSAAAAGNLVQKLGGSLLGYIFIMELDFLKGRDKLNAPVHTLLSGQEEGLNNQA
jgi:adenine phosphoribosyltransferase